MDFIGFFMDLEFLTIFLKELWLSIGNLCTQKLFVIYNAINVFWSKSTFITKIKKKSSSFIEQNQQVTQHFPKIDYNTFSSFYDSIEVSLKCRKNL